MENEKKKTGYQSTWQDQLRDTANKIINREKFTYDLNGDALYKQYKDRYIQQGKQAMMDTMGQAAALTGGYGNSYANQVGNQAYQQYLTALNDNVPELWDRAYQVYQGEGDRLLQKYQLAAAHPGTIEAIKPRTVTVTRTPKEDPEADPNANANDSYTQALMNAGLLAGGAGAGLMQTGPQNQLNGIVYKYLEDQKKK